MVGRPDYRLNAVLLRGITTSSLIACSCAIWINLGSCMHSIKLKIELAKHMCFICKIGWTAGFTEVEPQCGCTGAVRGTTALRTFRNLYGGSIKTEQVYFRSETSLEKRSFRFSESDEPHYGCSESYAAVVKFQNTCIFIWAETLISDVPEVCCRLYRLSFNGYISALNAGENSRYYFYFQESDVPEVCRRLYRFSLGIGELLPNGWIGWWRL